jgi:predicted flap endonuclease-1-like 5' DNA nuclease
MPWYVFELAAYLFVAIAFGIAIGWLIWGDEPFEVSSAVGGGADDEVVADLNSQVESRDQEIVRLRKRLKRMHADLDARDAHVTAAKGQAEELQSLLAQRDSELSMAIASPGEAGELQVRRLADLEEQLAASRHEASTLARQLQDSLAGTFAADGADRAGQVDEAALDALQADYDKLAAAHDSLDRAYSGISDELAETQARLEEVLNEGPDLSAHDRVRVLEAEVQQLRSDAQSSFRRAQVAEDALLSSRNALARLEQSRSDDTPVTDESNDQSERIAVLEQTVSQFETGQVALYEQIGDLEKSLVEAQSQSSERAALVGEGIGSQEADEIRFELSKVQTELARSRQSVTSLRQRLQEVEDENESLAGDLARASNELQTRNSRTSEQSAEQQRLTASITTLRDESATLSSKLAAAEQARQQADQARQQADQALQQAEQARQQADKARQQAVGASEEAARGLAAQRAETESSLAGLHVELSDARLRADAAYEALEELTQEFVTFREVTMRQQTTMNELAERLDRARTTLVGRGAPVVRAEDDDVIDDLLRLPNMTPTLHAHLLELGVTTYSEIAAWTPSDVTRIETMLGEPEKSLAARGWVEKAKALIADQPQR